MITGYQDRANRSWDLETRRVVKTVIQEQGITEGVYSPDGKLLLTGGFKNEIFLWDAKTLDLLAGVETGHEKNMSVAFSPDGKRMASGAWDGSVSIWNAETREKIRELPQQELVIGGLAFSPDGELLATATGNLRQNQKPGNVKLWNVKTGEEVASLPGPVRKMRQVRFSPDGRTLIAGGSQTELLVYDVPNRKLTGRLAIGSETSCAAFLPDSRTLVIGRFDGKVELWNVESRQRVANCEGHTQSENEENRYIFDVAVSADGSVMASAGADGHVKLWPASALTGRGHP